MLKEESRSDHEEGNYGGIVDGDEDDNLDEGIDIYQTKLTLTRKTIGKPINLLATMTTKVNRQYLEIKGEWRKDVIMRLDFKGWLSLIVMAHTWYKDMQQRDKTFDFPCKIFVDTKCIFKDF